MIGELIELVLSLVRSDVEHLDFCTMYSVGIE
jgi:hypothetical protein